MARKRLRELTKHRDSVTSTNVKLRLAAVERALTKEPMDDAEANKALREAVRKLTMRPQEGRLDILWHHADEPQQISFITRRFDWSVELGGFEYTPDDKGSEKA